MGIVGRLHRVGEHQSGRRAFGSGVTGLHRRRPFGESQFYFGRASHRHGLRKRHRDLDRVVLDIFAVVAGIRGDPHALDRRGGGGKVADPEDAGERQVARCCAVRTRRPAQGVPRDINLRSGTCGCAERLRRRRPVIVGAGANELVLATGGKRRAILQCRTILVVPAAVVEVGVVVRDFRAVQPIDRYAAGAGRSGMRPRIHRGGRPQNLEVTRIRLDFRVAVGGDTALHIRVVDRDVRRIRIPRISPHEQQAKFVAGIQSRRYQRPIARDIGLRVGGGRGQCNERGKQPNCETARGATHNEITHDRLVLMNSHKKGRTMHMHRQGLASLKTG